MKNIAFAAILLLGGCAYLNPVIQEFNIVSVEEEKAIGDQVAKEVAKEMQIVSDPEPNLRVRSLGERLEAVLPQHPFDYQFYVVNNQTPNAFTIPGGSIYVHTGLLKFVDDDNQLAGILAHEMGHMYERHPAKSLSRAYGIERLSNLIFKGNQQKQFRDIALGIAGGSLLLRYSREDELEADEISYHVMRRAGMPTNGLLRFLIKLNRLQGSGFQIPFMSSHPPTPERIHRLEMLERGNARSDRRGGVTPPLLTQKEDFT